MLGRACSRLHQGRGRLIPRYRAPQRWVYRRHARGTVGGGSSRCCRLSRVARHAWLFLEKLPSPRCSLSMALSQVWGVPVRKSRSRRPIAIIPKYGRHHAGAVARLNHPRSRTTPSCTKRPASLTASWSHSLITEPRGWHARADGRTKSSGLVSNSIPQRASAPRQPVGRVFASAFGVERQRSVDEALRAWWRARCSPNGRRPDELSWHRQISACRNRPAIGARPAELVEVGHVGHVVSGSEKQRGGGYHAWSSNPDPERPVSS